MPRDKTPIRYLHYLSEVDLEAGGVVRAVIDLLDHLSAAGANVTLVTHDPKDCPEAWSQHQKVRVIKVPKVKAAGLIVSRSLNKTITDLVREHDIVHLHTPWSVGHRVFTRAATSNNIPYLVTLHGMLDDWSMEQKRLKKKVYLKLFGRRLLEQAAFVHCTAAGEAQQSEKWYPKGRSLVLPYIVNLSPYDSPPTPDEAIKRFDHLTREGLKILFLSRIHVKKGLHRLIRACGILDRRGIAFQLGIAGPGDNDYIEKMKQLAIDEGIDSQTHFLGMVNGSLKLSLYAASDVFALPTSQENFGLVYPEALLCGTPIIGTKGTDIWSELSEGGGIICDMTPQAVADAIESIAQLDHQDRAALGQRGRQQMKAWLDPQQLTERYVDAYRQAIEQSFP